MPLERQMSQETVHLGLGQLPAMPVLVEFDVPTHGVHIDLLGAAVEMPRTQNLNDPVVQTRRRTVRDIPLLFSGVAVYAEPGQGGNRLTGGERHATFVQAVCGGIVVTVCTHGAAAHLVEPGSTVARRPRCTDVAGSLETAG